MKYTKASAEVYKIMDNMLEFPNIDDLITMINKIQDKTYKYIISIDMGCGNTSCAIGSTDNTILGEHLVKWKYKYYDHGDWILNNGNSIPTIIGYDDETVVIGPEAMKYGEVGENFKQLPTAEALDEDYYTLGSMNNVSLGSMWGHFIDKIMEFSITWSSSFIREPSLNKENSIVIIGYPSDKEWKDNLISFRNMICEHTKLKQDQVIVLTEAKASMQYVRYKKNEDVKYEDGVLIIDLGASTIDVGYSKYGLNDYIEYSLPMAGSHVDKLLGNYILHQIYPNEMKTFPAGEIPNDMFFEKHKQDLHFDRTAFKYAIRFLKEEICSTGEEIQYEYERNGQKQYLKITTEKLIEILQNNAFSFLCYSTQFTKNVFGVEDKLVVNGTWYASFQQFLTYIFKDLIKNRLRIGRIIVTGGTANLVGIKDEIIQCVKSIGLFDIDDKVVMLNDYTDYEQTVTVGNLKYVKTVFNYAKYILDEPNRIRQKIINDMLAKFPCLIRDKIYPYIDEQINIACSEWIDLDKKDVDSSLNGLSHIIGYKCCAENTQAEISKQIKEMLPAYNDFPVDIFPKTYKEITSFLKKLSISGKYDEPITFTNIKYNINPKYIVNGIQNSISSICSDYFTGIIARGWYSFHNNNSHIPKIIRKRVVDNIKQNKPFKDGILPCIKESLRNQGAGQNQFGLVDQIMSGLELHIKQAMFLSK